MSETKEHPILFSTSMVQAILEGKKTQTRRVVKNIPNGSHYLKEYPGHNALGMYPFLAPDELQKPDNEKIASVVTCPYGQPGDLLWVRETWCVTQPFDPETYHFGYKSGIQPYSNEPSSEKFNYLSPDKWKPSIHMPKAAARIWLEVEEVKVERLQDISEEEAKAEGCERLPLLWSRLDTFKVLWQSINGHESWRANPLVWVVKFKVISKTGKPSEIITLEAAITRDIGAPGTPERNEFDKQIKKEIGNHE